MAIKPPAWCPGAVPTKRGWEDPHSGELLISQKIPQSWIDSWHGLPTASEVKAAAPVVEEFVADIDPWSMTKKQLEELGREHGHELDRRHSKADLIDELEEAGII